MQYWWCRNCWCCICYTLTDESAPVTTRPLLSSSARARLFEDKEIRVFVPGRLSLVTCRCSLWTRTSAVGSLLPTHMCAMEGMTRTRRRPYPSLTTSRSSLCPWYLPRYAAIVVCSTPCCPPTLLRFSQAKLPGAVFATLQFFVCVVQPTVALYED